MIGLYQDALASFLRRRGQVDVATRIINPFATQPERLRALAEGMTVLGDDRTTALFVMLIYAAADSDAWGAVDTAMLGIPAAAVLVDLMADEDESVRYLAGETMAMRGVPARALHALLASPTPGVAGAAAWGLAVRGDTAPAILQLRAARELVPRLVVLGPSGLRALCRADVRCFPEGAFDEAATFIAERQRHRKVLEELTLGGSALATLALSRMDPETMEERIAAAIHGEA